LSPLFVLARSCRKQLALSHQSTTFHSMYKYSSLQNTGLCLALFLPEYVNKIYNEGFFATPCIQMALCTCIQWLTNYFTYVIYSESAHLKSNTQYSIMPDYSIMPIFRPV